MLGGVVRSERWTRGEGGAATVLVVAMAGVLMFVMVGLAAAGGQGHEQRDPQGELRRRGTRLRA